MGTIQDAQDAIRKVDLRKVTLNAMEQNPNEIVDLNREQLNSGRYADGSSIQPEYTPLTKWLKQQKGQPTDRVTLRDTGEFQSKMFLQIRGDEFSMLSSDDKYLALKQKYDRNGELFELSQENAKRTWAIVHDNVVKQIGQITGFIVR